MTAGGQGPGRRGKRMALTRGISPALGDCELTHLPRRPIDVDRAEEQHRQYERLLEELGCRVQRLPAGPEMADAVFVEDTAVVLDEIAIIARPGAASRRQETEAVAGALASYRELAAIAPPGTLDGGDVLRAGRTVYVGCTSRTNAAGCDQLARLLEPLGYVVRRVPVTGCLHLKSAATEVALGTVLVNPQWVRPDTFCGLEAIEVHPDEPYAANALRLGDVVVEAAAFPRTRERLEERGIRTCVVDASELAKAEGGVTCCSLVFQA